MACILSSVFISKLGVFYDLGCRSESLVAQNVSENEARVSFKAKRFSVSSEAGLKSILSDTFCRRRGRADDGKIRVFTTRARRPHSRWVVASAAQQISNDSQPFDLRIFVLNDELDRLNISYARIDFRGLANCVCDVWNELNASVQYIRWMQRLYSEMRDIKQRRIKVTFDDEGMFWEIG